MGAQQLQESPRIVCFFREEIGPAVAVSGAAALCKFIDQAKEGGALKRRLVFLSRRQHSNLIS